MNRFNISILEYLGKLDIGILVLISIIYDEVYYEGTYFYTSEDLLLTIPEDLEEKLGYKIADDIDYVDILKSIMKKVVPYDEIYGRLDDVDFSRWDDEIEKAG